MNYTVDYINALTLLVFAQAIEIHNQKVLIDASAEAMRNFAAAADGFLKGAE